MLNFHLLFFSLQSKTDIQQNRGWSGLNVETLDPATQDTGDFKEAFNWGEFSTSSPPTPSQTITPALTPNVPTVSAFSDNCHQLCLKLLYLFGLGLDVEPADWLKEKHSRELGDSGTILRWLYYPSLSLIPGFRPEKDIRCGAHSDYGSLTLLFQRPSQPGLEVQTPEGKWAAVPVFPPGTESDPSPPILVNVGDLLSFWTGGVLRSTIHRVLFPTGGDGKDRYSMAFFCHPAHNTALDPVPSKKIQARIEELKEKGEGGKRDMTAFEHLRMKLESTYKMVNFQKEEEAKS